MKLAANKNTVFTLPTSAFRGWLLLTFISLLLITCIIGAVQLDNVWAWSVGVIYVVYDTWLLTYVAWKTRKLQHITSALPLPNTTKSRLTNSQQAALTFGVLVPVHNESKVILATLARLISQQQKAEQIIIVNDGSTDDTLSKLNHFYNFSAKASDNPQLLQSSINPNLYLLNKHNSGKADSLNQAIAHLNCDVVITVDADTLLEPDAISEIKTAFNSQTDLVAACGILTPTTHGSLLVRIFGGLQYFEYMRAFFSRAAWTQSNALLLVSGAFSAYNKHALLQVGGYDHTSLVEDYELIHRMHKHSCEHDLNWQVNIIETARATTDAPSNVATFIQQRKRWFAGFLRTQFKYRHMIGNAHYQNVGRLMLPIKTLDTLQPIFGLVALYLLLNFLFTDSEIAGSVLVIILIKLVIDYFFHLWTLHKYHAWLGQAVPKMRWWQATLCCLVDPFFFQPLRHFSALIGWSMILKNNVRWEPIRLGSTQ